VSGKIHTGAGVDIVGDSLDAKGQPGNVDISDLLDVWVDDHMGLRSRKCWPLWIRSSSSRR